MIGIISYIQVLILIVVGCLAYLALLRDVIVETHIVELLLVICEFQANFLGLSPEQEIKFEIEVEMGTRLISIPQIGWLPKRLRILVHSLTVCLI